MTKSELLRETGLNARDLIVLDSGFHRRPRPEILIRPTSFVVSVANVRAIIRHDAVYLFHPSQPKVQAFVMRLSEYLQGKRAPFLPHVYLGSSQNHAQRIHLDEEDEEECDAENEAVAAAAAAAAVAAADDAGEGPDSGARSEEFGELGRLPFELRALEGILSHVTHRFHNRTLLLSPLVKNVLHTLSSRPVDPETLHQLFPMKDSLSQFEIESTLMRNVLSELIHHEEDMLQMLLSERAARGGELPPRKQHEQVELLLENYCSQLVDVAQEAYYLRKRVESTQSIMELKLDAHRNYMLRISIQISIASMSLALGTAMTGLFGANLVSGLEEHPTAFYWLAAGSVGSVVGVFSVLRKHLERAAPRPLEVNQAGSIFNHLDEIQQILAVARSRRWTGARHLSRTELKTMLGKIAGANVNEEDLDVLYDTFDLNKDGCLGTAEMSDAIRADQTTRRSRKLEWLGGEPFQANN